MSDTVIINTCDVSNRKCKYWRQLCSSGDEYACHYCLETGKPRKKDADGNCLSCTTKGAKKYEPYWHTRR